MSRLVRVILYSFIVIVLYYVIHEIISVYHTTANRSIPDATAEDTSMVATDPLDTLIVDSLLSDVLITNEEIVGGGGVSDIAESNTERVKTPDKNEIEPEPTPKKPEVSTKAKAAAAEKPAQKTPAPIKSSAKSQTSQPEPAPSRPAVKPAPKQQPVKQEAASVVSQPGDGGKYLVMAGSYLLRDNATKMVKKLREMGYIHAEVMIFPESEFHSVVAVRYANEAKAQAAVTELKRKGIDCFVKIK